MLLHVDEDLDELLDADEWAGPVERSISKLGATALTLAAFATLFVVVWFVGRVLLSLGILALLVHSGSFPPD